MIKGKTSMELCSGESEFNKIYPQDISKTHPGGKLNIVIYPKPLAVVYRPGHEQSSDTGFIDAELI